MQFRYGNYTHAANEATVTRTIRPVYSPRGAVRFHRNVVTISGQLQAADQASLTTALAALEAAYAVNGQDFVLLDNTSTATVIGLDSANTHGGVRVTAFDYPQGDGAVYATHMPYHITLEADVIPATGPGLRLFRESLEFIGTGGPTRIFLPVLNGPPQEQILRQQSTQRCIQTGEAVSDLGYVSLPAPLFPTLEHVDQRRIRKTGPDVTGGTLDGYRIAWTYFFEGLTDQSAAVPTVV